MNLWQRIQLLFGKKRFERELDDEVRFHVEAQTEANIRAGMTPQEARRQAMLELGGIEQTKEQVREGRWGHFAETLWQDTRYGARMRQARFSLPSTRRPRRPSCCQSEERDCVSGRRRQHGDRQRG